MPCILDKIINQNGPVGSLLRFCSSGEDALRHYYNDQCLAPIAPKEKYLYSHDLMSSVKLSIMELLGYGLTCRSDAQVMTGFELVAKR